MDERVPHYHRFNDITHRCPLKKCVNESWLQTKVAKENGFLGHYMRVHNLDSLEEAHLAREHDYQVKLDKHQSKMEYNKIRDHLKSKQDIYYVDVIRAKYNPYDNDSFHNIYVVYKEYCREDSPKYRSKKEVARFDNASEAHKLCNQLSCSVPHVTEKDVEEYKICPRCGHPLAQKEGRYGEFIGCSNYPNCDYSRKAWVES